MEMVKDGEQKVKTKLSDDFKRGLRAAMEQLQGQTTIVLAHFPHLHAWSLCHRSTVKSSTSLRHSILCRRWPMDDRVCCDW